MEKVIINGKEYQLDVDKAIADGYLKKQNDRANSWDELSNKLYNQQSYFTNEYGTKKETHYTSIYSFVNEDDSKGIATFCKLMQLRRDWVKDWKPDWSIGDDKWVIEHKGSTLRTNWYNTYARTLSFPTEEMAEEFLNTHKELLERAKNFI